MKSFAAFAFSLCALVTDNGIAGNWAPSPAGSPAALVQRLDSARWVATGSKSSARVVYVFTDPECPFCNKLWQAMRTARAPDVQVRNLLVAVIDADSRGKDAAILESKDPAAAFEQNERDYDHGGIATKPTVQSTTNETISANEALMAALHIYGTPGLVYVDEQNQVKVFAGMPDAAQLRQIVGKR